MWGDCMKKLVFAFCGFLLLTACTNKNIELELQSAIELPSQETSITQRQLIEKINSVFAEQDEVAAAELKMWQDTNSDVCYIIDIPGLSVREPVVSATVDNNQWLRTNIYGERDIAGCVFLDYHCASILNSVKLIHGHNMKDGSMFGNLPTLLTITDCGEAPVINLYTEDGWLEYSVFSVLSIDSTKETLPLDNLLSTNDVTEMARDLLERSQVPGGKIESEDILVLNTCWYGSSGSERNLHCIVAASRNGLGGS